MHCTVTLPADKTQFTEVRFQGRAPEKFATTSSGGFVEMAVPEAPDAFDRVVLLEAELCAEGEAAGRHDGARQGHAEGYAMGQKLGRQIGIEVGNDMVLGRNLPAHRRQAVTLRVVALWRQTTDTVA